MDVPVPFSRAFVLLALALPAVWLLARALAHAVTRDRSLRAVLPMGLAPALWVLAVHVAARIARSFLIGLPAGVLALAVAGVVAELVRRRRPGPPAEGAPPSQWMWLSMAVTAAALAPSAFGHWFHDEIGMNGHLEHISAIQNGIYPPRYVTFPDLPLRYHYGFDMFCACLTALFRLRVDQAIDVATLLLWLPSWCLLWVMGDRFVGRAGAWMTPMLVLLGGNVPVLCTRRNASAISDLVDSCNIGKMPLFGQSISYFFQHPWALGIPVAMSAILVFSEREPPSPRARLVVLALLLSILSLCQLVLFAGLLPSMVVAEVHYQDRTEWERLGPIAAVALVAVVGARLMGGFLATAPGLTPLPFTLHAGFCDTLFDTIRWNLQSFGVRLFLGVAGLFVLRRGRLLFGLVLAGSLVVVNSLRYANSLDIIKFANLAGLGMGVPGAAALVHLLPSGPIRGDEPSRTRTATVALLFTGSVVTSVLFLMYFFFDRSDVAPYYRLKPMALTAPDAAAIDWIRRRAQPGELVYRSLPVAQGYAQWGGLPEVWPTKNIANQGYPAAKTEARERALDRNIFGVAEARRQRIRWLVLDGTPRETALATQVGRWVSAGLARVAVEIGPLQIVEVLP